ncbi:putative ankyrin repeat protein [Cladobotryum mycophilum]|uniref:Ankyrin repeat protein n=1 Tax=Cladobotryum mycophilum TaxID=491253 RepID=A0ABR0SGV9_9HYPO
MARITDLVPKLPLLIAEHTNVFDLQNLLDTFPSLLPVFSFQLATKRGLDDEIFIHRLLFCGRSDLVIKILKSLWTASQETGFRVSSQELQWRLLFDWPTHQGKTLLHLAVRSGSEDLVKYILDQTFARVYHLDRRLFTPLAEAVRAGRESIVRLLLQRNIDPDLGVTCRPLCIAAAVGGEAIVNLLLDHRADVNGADRHGQTPLCHAMTRKRTAVVKVLLSRHDVYAQSRSLDGRTMLSHAASQGSDDIIKLLLKRSEVDANTCDWNGRSPLHWAVKKGHTTTIKLLLNIPNLLINTGDNTGDTALHEAVRRGNVAAVQLLLSRRDISVNGLGSERRTPLGWAASTGNIDIVRILLDRPDIMVHETSDNPATALEIAVYAKATTVIPALMERHSPSSRILLSALHTNNEKIATWCVESKAMDPNARIKYTPFCEGAMIHAAAMYGNEATERRTALHVASQFGRDNIVKMLLELTNIDINAKTSQGETALHLAIDGKGENGQSTLIVTMLLSQDSIQPNLEDESGKSALCVAVYTSSTKVMTLLLNRQDVELADTNLHALTILWYASLNMDVVAVEQLLNLGAVKNKFILGYGRQAEMLIEEGPGAVKSFLMQKLQE